MSVDKAAKGADVEEEGVDAESKEQASSETVDKSASKELSGEGSGEAGDQSDSGRAAEAEGDGESASDAVSDGESASEEEPIRGRFQKRIDILTRQKREAERQREEAIRYAKSVMEDNQKLRDRGVGVAETAIGTAEARYTAEYEVAKRDLKEAFEAGDAEKIADAQSRIAGIAVERSKLKDYTSKIKQEREAKPAPQARQEEERLYQAPEPRAVEWAEKNPWFGKDEVATQVAWTLHGRLVRGGIDPRSEEYWDRLDQGLREELPHKFQKTSAQQTTQQSGSSNGAQQRLQSPVASAKRSGHQSAKTVQLTPSQEHIVRRLGITREAYMASLKAMEN